MGKQRKRPRQKASTTEARHAAPSEPGIAPSEDSAPAPASPVDLYEALDLAIEAMEPAGECGQRQFRLLVRVSELAHANHPGQFLVDCGGITGIETRPAPPADDAGSRLGDICQRLIDMLLDPNDESRPPDAAMWDPDTYWAKWIAQENWRTRIAHERGLLGRWLERRVAPRIPLDGIDLAEAERFAGTAGFALMKAIDGGAIIGDKALTDSIRLASTGNMTDQNIGPGRYAHAFITAAHGLLARSGVKVGTFAADWRTYVERGDPLIDAAIQAHAAADAAGGIPDDLLTFNEAARHCVCSPPTIRRAVRKRGVLREYEGMVSRAELDAKYAQVVLRRHRIRRT